MKAAVYYQNGGPEVFRYEDVPDPVPGEREVLIKVEAISIEGGDLINRELRPLPKVPHIVGYQCCGIVVDVGPSVETRSVGDRVTAILPWGSHAELAAAKETDTWIVPPGIDPIEAAAVPVAWGTAHECLFEFGRLQKEETVLIHAAAGALGLAAIQLAKRVGARVVGTSSSPQKLKRLKDYGLDVGINYRDEDFVDVVKKLTDGAGADVILDSVGGSTLSRSIQVLNYRGRVITVGVSGRDMDRPDPVSLWRGNKTMQGVYFPNSLDHEHHRVHAVVTQMLRDVAANRLEVVIDRTFALAEVAAAHEYVASRQSFGRVVMIP